MPNRTSTLPYAGTAIPPAILAYTTAPWWAVIASAIPGTIAVILNALIPQDSHDRLDLWRAWLRHRRH